MDGRVISAKRAAWLTVAGLVLALAVLAWVFRPAEGLAPGGVGLKRVLIEERAWRRELWRDGGHVNEQEPWLIQETLAARCGISSGVLKGLARRAVNARDAGYRAEGHLLAGNLGLAAHLCDQLAAWHQRADDPLEAARWLHRRADAVWRGVLEDAGAGLREALRLAPVSPKSAPLRRELWMDLAAWHWERALFRPEDPRAELAAALEALQSLAGLSGVALEAGDEAALWRRAGEAGLRLACLTREAGALESAEESFERAVSLADALGAPWEERGARAWHGLGLARLEQGRHEEARAALQRALAVREPLARSGGGRVDVRVLERRLTARLETQAFLALAIAGSANADKESAAREAAALAQAVLSMTLPEDTGPAWIAAVAAQLLLARAAGDVETAARLAEHGQRHYPRALAGEPGLPPESVFGG
jgi:tetratricopeptide (TPR) repeat protein